LGERAMSKRGNVSRNGGKVRRMKSAFVLFLLPLLPACATRSHVIGYYPDGSVAQEVECRQDHPEKCQERSQELCRHYYRQPQIVRPMAYDSYRARWTMVITCGPPVNAPPPM